MWALPTTRHAPCTVDSTASGASLSLLRVTPVILSANVRLITLRRVARRVELRGSVLLFYSVSAPCDVHSALRTVTLSATDRAVHDVRDATVVHIMGYTLGFASSEIAAKFSTAIATAVARIAGVSSLRILGHLNPAIEFLLGFTTPTSASAMAGVPAVRIAEMDGDFKQLLVKSVPKADALFTETDTRRLIDQRVALERAAASASPFLSGLVLAFESENAFNFVTRSPELPTLSYLLAMTPHGRLPEHISRYIFAELCLALHDVHRLGLLLRNVSPETISFTMNGHIRFCNFDLAKPVAEPRSAYDDSMYEDLGDDILDKEASAWIGRARSIIGKRLYMSPEHLSAGPVGGGSYGASVDYWALGITLYIMLTGRHPLLKPNDSTEALFTKINSAKIKFPRYVSQDARSVIEGLLDRDENSRFTLRDVKRCAWMAGVDWDAIEIGAVKQESQKEVLRVVRAAGLQTIDVMVGRSPTNVDDTFDWGLGKKSSSPANKIDMKRVPSRLSRYSLRTRRKRKIKEICTVPGFAFGGNTDYGT